MSDDLLKRLANHIKETGSYLELDEDDGFGVVERNVHTDFYEGGRWSNFEVEVFKVQDRFFRFTREVPATEMQEGGYFSHSLKEVFPREVMITKYMSKKNDKSIEWSNDD